MRAIVKQLLSDTDGSFVAAIGKTKGIQVIYKSNVSIGDDLGEWHAKDALATMIACPDGNSYLVEAV